MAESKTERDNVLGGRESSRDTMIVSDATSDSGLHKK